MVLISLHIWGNPVEWDYNYISLLDLDNLGSLRNLGVSASSGFPKVTGRSKSVEHLHLKGSPCWREDLEPFQSCLRTLVLEGMEFSEPADCPCLEKVFSDSPSVLNVWELRGVATCLIGGTSQA